MDTVVEAMEVSDSDENSPKVVSSKPPKKSEHSLSHLKQHVGKNIKLLRHNSGKSVRQGLLAVRSLISKYGEPVVEIFSVMDGFSHLIKLLTSTNEKLVSFVIQLASLCWDNINMNSIKSSFACAGFIVKISDILNKTSDITIQKRSLRLITSMTQCPGAARSFVNSEIAKSTTKVLLSSQDNAIQLACIRALRFMWSVDKHSGKLLTNGSVKAVATFLSNEDQEISTRALKALVVFTTPCTIAASEQVSGKGDGYSVIVSRVGSSIISGLICNLSRSPLGRIELTRAGLVPQIINQLRSNKFDKYLIMALCHMCQESMVRASLRSTPSGFETFISLIADKSAAQYHSDLLYAVTYFNYDKQSLLMMIKVGLVKVLIDKLEEINDEVPPIKHPAPCIVATESSDKSEKPPPRPMSPTMIPLCPFPSQGSRGSNQKNPKKEASLIEECPSQDSCILEVLLQLIYHCTPLKTLAQRNTIDTLVRYLATTPLPSREANYSRAVKILISIVTCKHYFIDLLEGSSLMAIHRGLVVDAACGNECSRCVRLRQTGKTVLNRANDCAESDFGRGELEDKLASSNSQLRLTVGLTIPLIIRSPPMLYSLLMVHAGLSLLTDAMDTHLDDVVPALSALMSTAGVVNPQKPQTVCGEESSCRKEGSIADEDVTFLLDSGETVRANREKLSEKYPMFAGMFRGGFRESELSTVPLTDMSAPCLRAIIRLAGQDCTCHLPMDANLLLEMAVAADKLLVESITQAVLSHVLHNVLSPETCALIYSWGHTTRLPQAAGISINAVRYLFTAENVQAQERLKAVQEILDSPHRDLFITDIVSIIVAGLKREVQQPEFKVQKMFINWSGGRILGESNSIGIGLS